MAQRKNFLTAAYGSSLDYGFTLPQADNNPAAKLVVILGHSYVANLCFGSIFVCPPFKFHKLAARGATVESIQSSSTWERLYQLWPAPAILLIGSNNITSQTSPWELAQAIEALMQQIEHLTHGSWPSKIGYRPEVCLVSSLRPLRIQLIDGCAKCCPTLKPGSILVRWKTST